MAEKICPRCKKPKENLRSKIVGKSKIKDPRFTKPIDTLKTLILCEDCWAEIEKGGE
jgi:hypothetical protein